MGNRLASEASAYLRQHASNPVDWYPWGEEAHRAARETDRPVLLSIGYSACHWCHVMAHESFEDPAIARSLNEGFVCIKVDREERPDLDALYQGVVQLIGARGGWPLTVFLTPQLEPFFGGTYFPPEDRPGMPGLPRVLTAIREAWTERREELVGDSRRFKDALHALLSAGLGGGESPLSREDPLRAGARVAAALDPEEGGLGQGGPRFPHPAALELVLRAFRRTREPSLLEPALKTLEAMASRGLFDHLGGGFHRYCVDAAWQVPHFEKMLYDNGQLLRLFARAFQLRSEPGYRRAAELTAQWLQREMTSPEGGFYASQDADSGGEEGRFFVWTPQEVREAVGEELSGLLCRRFGIDERGNFEGGRTVLSLATPVATIAAEAGKPEAEVEAELELGRLLLLQARRKRIHPGRDEKILAGWNGLAIGGLAIASRAFAMPEWARLASRAADFVLGHLWQASRLGRAWAGGGIRADGQLEDYGDLAEGLVQLYMATFEPRYLEAARDLADRAVALFWDEGQRAFRAAPRDGEPLLAPVWALHDDAWPSGASTLCEALLALSALCGEPAREELVRTYLSRLREPMLDSPVSFARLWCAADTLLDGAPSLAVAGEPEARGPLLSAVDRRFEPTLSVAAARREAPPLLEKAFSGKRAPEGAAAAWLCRDRTCEPPVARPEELERRLEAAALAVPGGPS